MYAISEKNKTNLVQEFLLSDLQKDNFNPRKELIAKNLEKLRMSEVFAPVIIGKYKDKFFLVDGYHRKTIVEERAKNTIDAIIYEYENEWAMKTDAYSFNINHGERLTDEEIGTGIFNKYNYYAELGTPITFEKLGKEFSMSTRMVNSYVRWGKVKLVLNEDVAKSISDVLARFEDTEEGKEKMIQFYNSFRRLKTLEMRKAYDYYLEGKDYYKETLLLQQGIDLLNLDERMPENKEKNKGEKIETFEGKNQNIAAGESYIDELNKSMQATPTVLEVKSILKNLIKNMKNTYEQMQNMKENNQLKFYPEYKKEITALSLLVDDVNSFVDEGWVDQKIEEEKE